MIETLVNGEKRVLDEPTTLAQALALWGYSCTQIAVAINSEFIARANYPSTWLKAHDRLDVVAPVQGG